MVINVWKRVSSSNSSMKRVARFRACYTNSCLWSSFLVAGKQNATLYETLCGSHRCEIEKKKINIINNTCND